MPDPVVIQDVVLVILLWLLVDRLPKWWTRHDDLGITLFRPWRGDPWPRGVQEDDDFRFDWRPARAVSGSTLHRVVDLDGSIDGPIGSEPMTAWIDDAGGTERRVTLERPEHVEIHRAGR